MKEENSQLDKNMLTELNQLSSKIKKESLQMIFDARSGHPGGALSCSDILAYLVKFNYNNPLILSKGHSCPALYSAMAELKILKKEELTTFRKIGSKLQGHPDVRTIPEVFASTGSLGQGFSVAIGLALANKYLNKLETVFVILGDGELQEGQVWEGAMFSSHNNLSNLCAIIDYNKMQSDDLNENILNIEPLADKWKAFGWNVFEIDGHNFNEIHNSFLNINKNDTLPNLIIANTTKGKGISYMEGSPKWHGSVTLTEEQLEIALTELGGGYDS